ncbi:heparinase II/III family protein, partial [uncultured Nostoc sp.]|uniref:heparinase II/III domain-containing protein n=1 Tax=uncultured Nostoc sp. TaxID=340711 RepID=UPI0035CB3437
MIVRDRWHNTSTVLAVQAGYEPLRSSGHRHEDQNSFILSYGSEDFFVDPGHCCYRLDIQAHSKSAPHHSTWTFITKKGASLKQKPILGSIYKKAPVLNKLKLLCQ